MQKKQKFGLARALSKMGYCSRSQAAELIRAGRVLLNGRSVRDPEAPVRLGRDHISVDDLGIEKRELIYLVMNKPRGIVTTASDEKGRVTVYEFLKPGTPWVGPVGRLDKASEGLLLLSNDSAWAAKITDPASHLDKHYHVQVDRVADDDLLHRVTNGVNVGEAHLRAKTAQVLRAGTRNSWLDITLDEGKNRQIRRLLEALNVEVLRLVRVAIGPIQLGDLEKGAVRPLTPIERKALDRALLAGS